MFPSYKIIFHWFFCYNRYESFPCWFGDSWISKSTTGAIMSPSTVLETFIVIASTWLRLLTSTMTLLSNDSYLQLHECIASSKVHSLFILSLQLSVAWNKSFPLLDNETSVIGYSLRSLNFIAEILHLINCLWNANLWMQIYLFREYLIDSINLARIYLNHGITVAFMLAFPPADQNKVSALSSMTSKNLSYGHFLIRHPNWFCIKFYFNVGTAFLLIPSIIFFQRVFDFSLNCIFQSLFLSSSNWFSHTHSALKQYLYLFHPVTSNLLSFTTGAVSIPLSLLGALCPFFHLPLINAANHHIFLYYYILLLLIQPY